ncbi:MAG TPA: DoxX family protein [Humisphaera sp.]
MNERRQGLLTSIGLLVLRVGAGGYLMTHGWGKLVMAAEGKFAGFPDPLGIGSTASLISAAGAEFFCALLVALGLLTRLAAIPVAFTMGVAAFVIHQGAAWTMSGVAPGVPSREPAMVFLACFVALIFTGPGWFSLDALVYPYLGRRRARRRQHQTQDAHGQQQAG